MIIEFKYATLRIHRLRYNSILQIRDRELDAHAFKKSSMCNTIP